MREKIRLHRIEQGVCPYCGSMDIDYGCSQHEDDMMEKYPATCCDCGRNFEEWYHLEFTGHNVGDNCDIVLDEGNEGVEIEVEKMGANEEEPFSVENGVWNVSNYLEQKGYARREVYLEEFEKIMPAETFTYPIDEIKYLMEDVGGKFVLVRFPNEYGGFEYRWCEL